MLTRAIPRHVKASLYRSLLVTTATALLAPASSLKNQVAAMHTNGGTTNSPTLTIDPPQEHRTTIIFMHGLGDTAYGWSPVFEHYNRLPGFEHTRMVLPTAPEQPVSINNGMRMPSWYDITLGPRAAMECDGIEDSRRNIEELIEYEIAATGIPRSHIILGGFSQGAALSFYTGLQSKPPLLGIIALSGYVPLFGHLSNYTTNFDSPILQCHGSDDPMVPPELGEESSKLLKDLNLDITFHMIPNLDHGFNQQEDAILKAWLLERLTDAHRADVASEKSKA